MMGVMALRTAFTEFFSLRHPIALAPMGGVSGGALAAAVANGGGLGLSICRWVASAHGGISHRLKPGRATIRSLLSNPAMADSPPFSESVHGRTYRAGADQQFS